MSGFVWYDGPSELTGDPIVAIATNATRNAKTGDMWQTWIIRADMPPTKAVRTGADRGVCGDCAMRGPGPRTCYVTMHQAPSAIYYAWLRGSYDIVTPAQAAQRVRGQLVRGGSYGDPTALPAAAWMPIIQSAKGWTAYTHQWRNYDWIRPFAMASVETIEDMRRAQSMGWRTFRTRRDGQPLEPKEFGCPASDEAGNTRQCSSCLACHGADRPNQASVSIILHGALARRSNHV